MRLGGNFPGVSGTAVVHGSRLGRRNINGAGRAMVSPGHPARPRDFALYAFRRVRSGRTACADTALMHGAGNATHGPIRA